MAPVLRLQRWILGSVFGVLAGLGASAFASTIDIAQTPLFLTVDVKPNIMVIVDDSGSMDSEVLFPTNDGALWWHTGNQSYTGLDNNDDSSAGTINFNKVGTAGDTWKKYVYLFPNGTATGDRVYADQTNDHYAIAPIPAYAYARSPDFNAAYFDPGETYEPWAGYGDTTFGQIDPTSAPSDPVRGTYRFNLTEDIQSDAGNATFRMQNGSVIPAGTYNTRKLIDGTWTPWDLADSDVVITPTTDVAIKYFPATYYRVHGTVDNTGNTNVAANVGKSPSDDPAGACPADCSLDRYEIKPGNYATTAEYTAAINNFANWFSYYRKRHLATRGGIGNSFNSMGHMRVGSFRINNRDTVTMRDLDLAADKNSFYSTIYGYVGSGGTPNREALDHAGDQLMRTTSAPIVYACQQNFAVLFTDGYAVNWWGAGVGNADGEDSDYSGFAPYSDTVSNTIADIAMHYYRTNLNTDFPAGKVIRPPQCEAATHQPSLDCNPDLHMVTFAVTLGQQGEVYGVDSDATADPYTYPPTWPTDFPDRHPSAIDDLWHATINGRGVMLNATTPAEITDKFRDVLQNIIARTSSAASVALNSGSLNANTKLFQARFNSGDWSGQLLEFPISTGDGSDSCNSQAEGTLCDLAWDAGALLDDQVAAGGWSTRTVLTTDSAGAGVSFVWDDLSAGQQALLNDDPATTALDSDGLGEDRLNYLRGNRTLESGTFRTRTHVLGDIIDSDPYFVGRPSYPYSFDGYANFAAKTLAESGASDRTPMVYVGANDGMLHGFRADNGAELLAYVPGWLFPKLNQLTSMDYSHAYYVDGSPTAGDVYYDAAWHTVLVGGLRGGGQAMFALDVTNPETFGPSSVLWEFTDANDPDLGYTFSQPSIIRVRDGDGYRWVAVFGNGYNSTEADDNGACDDGSDTTPCTVSSSGHAVLYIVDIKTGAVVKKLDTGAGTSDNPNGLSTPAPVDVDGDYVADYVYAGDLQGNLWKFDLTSTDLTSTESPPTPNWTVAFDGNPLFTPTTLGAQPITSRPEIGPHPDGISAGVLVYFGTGQYMATGDNTITDDMPDQTFYAIWDKDDGTTRVTGRGDLQVQTITDEVDFLTGNACTGTAGEVCVRLTSDNAVDWSTKTGWYMDTYTNGERIVSNPFLRNKRIVFTTLIPDSDACEFGGTGWVMEMNAETGARLTYSPFDLNGDLQFTGDDKVTRGTGENETHVAASGRKSTVGLIPKPTVLAGDDQEFKYASGSTGNVQTLVENPGPEARGRVTWRQLR